MAYSANKANMKDSGETVKWTRPTISVPTAGQRSTKPISDRFVDSGQSQKTTASETVTFTRPTISLPNMKEQQMTPAAGVEYNPRRRISREDNVKSTDLEYIEKSRHCQDVSLKVSAHKPNAMASKEESVYTGRPTLNLQGKFSQEKSKDGQGNIALGGSLADRAQPAPMQESSSWVSKPKSQPKTGEHQNKMSHKHGAKASDPVTLTVDVSANRQKIPQQRQHGTQATDAPSWHRQTVDVKPDIHKQRQQNGNQGGVNKKLSQQGGQRDDSMSWTRPTITVNPNHQKVLSSQCIGKEAESASQPKHQKPRHVFGRQDGVMPDQQESPLTNKGHDELVVPRSRPTIAVKPNQNKRDQQVPSQQYGIQDGSQDGDIIAWTRPTIDIKHNRHKQDQRQDGIDPEHPRMPSQQYGGQDGSQDDTILAWTRPTIELRSNPHRDEYVPLYQPDNQSALDTMRDSHSTPDSSFGQGDVNQNSDLMLWNRPTIDLDVNYLGGQEHEDLPSPLMSALVRKPLQRQDSVTEIVAADLARIQALDLVDRKGVVVREVDEGQPCLRCAENCPGFISHQWRNICMNCKCARDVHDVYHDGFVNIWDRLGWELPKEIEPHSDEVAHSFGFSWIPPGVSMEKVEEYMEQLDNHKIPKLDTDGERYREIQLIHQLPKQDLSEEFCKHLKTTNHRKAFQDFCNARDTEAMGIGKIKEYVKEECKCARSNCGSLIEPGDMAVMATKLSEDLGWHPACFVCGACEELLVDLHYCHKDGQIFCERHYAELERPRCSACDELIFSGEYTKAMDQDWHSGHFCCWNCDLALTGHRYILRDEHPFCIKCYESLFANPCEECKTPIGTDSKDLSYKDKHWHEKCFKCVDCQKSLVDQPFASKDEKLYCADCHDNNFAPRCDGCGNVFKAGMKKFEFRGKQWHEECFICFACRQPIGNKRFIPRDHEFVCVPCYEEQFAQRCAKCNGVINKGGITYKGTPFHRDCFTCSNCSRVLAGEKFTSREERPYCADCFGELFAKKCCRCVKPITGLGGTKFISFDERHWHSDCFGCYKCGVSLVGRGFLTTGEDVVCPECGKTM